MSVLSSSKFTLLKRRYINISLLGWRSLREQLPILVCILKESHQLTSQQRFIGRRQWHLRNTQTKLLYRDYERRFQGLEEALKVHHFRRYLLSFSSSCQSVYILYCYSLGPIPVKIAVSQSPSETTANILRDCGSQLEAHLTRQTYSSRWPTRGPSSASLPQCREPCSRTTVVMKL